MIPAPLRGAGVIDEAVSQARCPLVEDTTPYVRLAVVVDGAAAQAQSAAGIVVEAAAIGRLIDNRYVRAPLHVCGCLGHAS